MDRLVTARLVLRPWDRTDLGPFARLARDERVMRFIGDGSIWSDARTQHVFERQLRHWGEHGFGWYSASLASTGRWAGFIGLNHVGPEAVEVTDDEVEIGWWLDPEVWGRGLATEGALAVRDVAFGRAGLERIIGRHRPANAASAAIMKRLGMTFERDATGRHGEVVRICALERDRWLRITGSEE
ncbi:MAG: GNAT family N-acetyltransferase [Actinomycetota bacterium]